MLVDEIEARARKSFIPPPKLALADWLEANVRLPGEVSALQGPIELWPFQREIANAMTDPAYERVSFVKGTRLGFSTLLTGTVAGFVVNDPCPVILIMPTSDDCRDYVSSELDPIFNASPVLRDALKADAGEADRNIMMSRRFRGGFLKILAARAPRNLRRHTARVVLLDELDGFETTIEGDPQKLAEQRSLSYSNRKIIVGSTPTSLETSPILKRYTESDQRIYECPCPACGEFVEILWPMIRWDEGKPETARFCCPMCGTFSDERHKFEMVAKGRWRVTRPDVLDHAGFRLNALVSPLAKASWAKLAAEFIAAKENPTDLQVFINCSLAEGWSEGGADIDDAALISRAKPFSIDAIPAEVLLITIGVDIQDDCAEATLVGWNRKGNMFILDHRVLWGSPGENHVWRELSDLLDMRFQHPHGGRIRVSATVIDSGDGDWTQAVYNFCFPRASRNVMAGKGIAGSRPIIEASKGKIQGGGGFGCSALTSLKRSCSTACNAIKVSFSAVLLRLFFMNNFALSAASPSTSRGARFGGLRLSAGGEMKLSIVL